MFLHSFLGQVCILAVITFLVWLFFFFFSDNKETITAAKGAGQAEVKWNGLKKMNQCQKSLSTPQWHNHFLEQVFSWEFHILLLYFLFLKREAGREEDWLCGWSTEIQFPAPWWTAFVTTGGHVQCSLGLLQCSSSGHGSAQPRSSNIPFSSTQQSDTGNSSLLISPSTQANSLKNFLIEDCHLHCRAWP